MPINATHRVVISLRRSGVVSRTCPPIMFGEINLRAMLLPNKVNVEPTCGHRDSGKLPRGIDDLHPKGFEAKRR